MRTPLFTIALTGLLLAATHVQAQIVLDDVMSKEEQQKTGVNKLSRNQKIALEAWLNKNFVLKQKSAAPTEQLYLSININGGQRLQLSDNSLWEINPNDIQTSSVWITPFPVKVESSNNPQYPYKITNVNSGASVQARQVSKGSSPSLPG